MNIIRSLPKKSLAVAVSGGVDSIALLHFLNRKHDVVAVHYQHDSEYANTELEFVETICSDWGIYLLKSRQVAAKPVKMSQEEYWRHGRYEYFKSLSHTICTGHTLDDAVEWFLFSALNGEGHYMDYRHANVVRPFITRAKVELLDYASTNGLKWLEDPSNQNVNFARRNRIRHELIPTALKINPGLYNMVKRRIEEKIRNG